MAPSSLIGDIVPVSDHRELGANSLFGRPDRPIARDDGCRGSMGGLNLCARADPTTGSPVASASGDEAAATQIVLTFDDNRLASALFGQYDQNLALIERRLGVVADSRGNQVTIEGSRDAGEQARRVLEGLYEQLKRGRRARLRRRRRRDPARHRAGLAVRLRRRPRRARASRRSICASAPVRARTAAQDAYIRALRRHELVFGTGPAGTGKTWLAVAHAVALLERKEVDRIVLSRPAVEAGERLGFLPGDMREKVDPYLRPIYDALYDLMDARHRRARRCRPARSRSRRSPSCAGAR